METIKKLLASLTKSQKTLILGLSLSAMMLVVSIFSKDGFVTVHEFEQELSALVQSNAALARENDRLRQEVHHLKTEPYEVEKIARQKLNLVKSGELVYKIVPPAEPDR